MACLPPLVFAIIVLMLTLVLDNAVKLLVSSLLGGLIGLERELRDKPAGLRTNTLVSLAATLLTILSVHPSFRSLTETGWDPSRIASAILGSMGFLGAGVIISAKGELVGITTAATLWIVAAVGMAVGLGELGLAVFTTFLILVVLRGLWLVEKFWLKGWLKKYD